MASLFKTRIVRGLLFRVWVFGAALSLFLALLESGIDAKARAVSGFGRVFIGNLVFNSFAVFLASLFIFFLFNRVLLRHLLVFVSFFRSVPINRLADALVLRGRPRSIPDELDEAVAAINAMQERMDATHRDLEKRIEDIRAVEKTLRVNEERLTQIISERAHMEVLLKRRLEFETLITSLSLDFVLLPAERMDESIHEMLGKIGRYIGAVRGSVFVYNEAKGSVRNTHEWCKTREESRINLLRNVSISYFSDFVPALMKREMVAVRRFSDLLENGSQREWTKRYGFQPFLVVPLLWKGSLYGLLAYYGGLNEEREWTEEHLLLLETAGGILVNALERKRAETSLLESEEKYRILVESLPEGFFLFRDRFLEVNDRLPLLLLLRKEELIGRTLQDFSPPVQPDGGPSSGADAFMSAALSGMPQHFHWRLLRRDGAVVETEIALKVVFLRGERVVLGSVHDITARERAEKALADEKDSLSVTLRSIGDGVITADVEGRVVLMNAQAEKLTGWSAAKAAGRPLQEVFSAVKEATGEACIRSWEEVKAGGLSIEPCLNALLSPRGGGEILISGSGAPIRKADGGITGMVIVFRDITESRRMEEKIINAAKLESIGVLAGGIAHDFNNLLAGMFGYIEMGERCVKSGKGEKAVSALSKAMNVYGRARSLTRQLLTFSKGGEPVRRTLALKELLKENAAFVLSGSNVTCEFAIAEDLFPVDADENQIAQVMDNLLINAQQAMPQGGRIRIHAENMEIAAGGSLPLPPGRYVKISIQDEGSGIPAEHLRKIFDPFFTTKKKGSGLGLSTAYSIVQRHGGHIEVESAPDKGAVFIILLPASLKNDSDPGAVRQDVRKGHGRILVMDDEDYIRDTTTTFLTEMGYEVECVKDGKEAVEAYRKALLSSRPFDLVILDLTIPGGMGGKEAVRELLKINPAVKAVASSGYSEDPVMSQPEKYGFTAAFAKPNTVGELSLELKRILGPS